MLFAVIESVCGSFKLLGKGRLDRYGMIFLTLTKEIRDTEVQRKADVEHKMPNKAKSDCS